MAGSMPNYYLDGGSVMPAKTTWSGWEAFSFIVTQKIVWTKKSFCSFYLVNGSTHMLLAKDNLKIAGFFTTRLKCVQEANV